MLQVKDICEGLEKKCLDITLDMSPKYKSPYAKLDITYGGDTLGVYAHAYGKISKTRLNFSVPILMMNERIVQTPRDFSGGMEYIPGMPTDPFGHLDSTLRRVNSENVDSEARIRGLVNAASPKPGLSYFYRSLRFMLALDKFSEMYLAWKILCEAANITSDTLTAKSEEFGADLWSDKKTELLAMSREYRMIANTAGRGASRNRRILNNLMDGVNDQKLRLVIPPVFRIEKYLLDLIKA